MLQVFHCVERAAERERHTVAAIAATGTPAKAERAMDAHDDANLRARVIAAVAREMGIAAPPEGSKSRDELADRLFHAVSAHSLARVELFTDRLRSMLQEAYFQSENDAGAYGAAWRREIMLNGKRGLADETDAALLERVLANVSHHYLVGANGIWFGDHEREFLTVMARDTQVEMMAAAINDLHDYALETAAALGSRYSELGLKNPFEEILAALEARPVESAPAA